MDLRISGRTALVTGASSGLGRAIALALAAEGVNVALAARREVELASVAEAVRALGAKALPLVWDLADHAAISRNVARIEAEIGPIDILVANTGGPPPATAAGVPADTWRAQFEAMVLSVIQLADAVLPGMRERGFGRILTVASSGVVAPIPNLALSNALRLSLVGWSKTLAREVAKDGITVNVVAPGRIDTDRVKSLDAARASRENRAVDAIATESRAAIPVGRYGRPEEFGSVVAFLAGEPAAFVTGSVLRVDGGQIPSI